MSESVKDITVEILISIRDEIRGLRAEVTGLRAEVTGLRTEITELRADTNRQFNELRCDIVDIRQNMKALLTRFDGDYMLVATEVDHLKTRVARCEKELQIA